MDSDENKMDGNHTDREQLKRELILVSTRMRKVVKNFLCGGITHKELFVLEILSAKGLSCENGIYVSELAEHIKISMPQASRMFKNMEEKGYIRREIDKNNRRNTFVYTTEQGKIARIKAKQEMDELIDCVITRMCEENIRKLIELFNMSTDIMEEELSKQKENQNV